MEHTKPGGTWWALTFPLSASPVPPPPGGREVLLNERQEDASAEEKSAQHRHHSRRLRERRDNGTHWSQTGAPVWDWQGEASLGWTEVTSVRPDLRSPLYCVKMVLPVWGQMSKSLLLRPQPL